MDNPTGKNKLWALPQQDICFVSFPGFLVKCLVTYLIYVDNNI